MINLIIKFLNACSRVRATLPSCIVVSLDMVLIFFASLELIVAITTIFFKLSNIDYVAFIPTEYPSWSQLSLQFCLGICTLLLAVGFISSASFAENSEK